MTLSFIGATLIAATAAMFLGGIWYSGIMFGNTWKRLTQTSDDNATPALTYTLSYLLMLVGAAVFGAFMGPNADLVFAVSAGFGAGFAWAAGSLWISYLFENRPLRLGLINGGYHIVQYSIFGLVFGLVYGVSQ